MVNMSGVRYFFRDQGSMKAGSAATTVVLKLQQHTSSDEVKWERNIGVM